LGQTTPYKQAEDGSMPNARMQKWDFKVEDMVLGWFEATEWEKEVESKLGRSPSSHPGRVLMHLQGRRHRRQIARKTVEY